MTSGDPTLVDDGVGRGGHDGRAVGQSVVLRPYHEVVQLRRALVSNRRIAMAIGILMRDQDVDETVAFSYLRRLSQNSNRKLHDVAEDVISWRRLPLPDGHASPTSPRGGSEPTAAL